jgi:hypothetical protein
MRSRMPLASCPVPGLLGPGGCSCRPWRWSLLDRLCVGVVRPGGLRAPLAVLPGSDGLDHTSGRPQVAQVLGRQPVRDDWFK